MVLTPSVMVPLGSKAPDFELPDTQGNTVRLSELDTDNGLLVMFICNHCPYVKHVADELAKLTRSLMDDGLAVVGISSNDVEDYPDDGPDEMAKEVDRRGYAFPYLFDETQEVARAYNAACTPDFFLFDGELQLFYRGQMDASRPGNDEPVTGADLRSAVAAMRAGEQPPEVQVPSAGCNIKWKA